MGEYFKAVKLFDKELRNAKHAYSKERFLRVDLSLNSRDPRRFWDEINKLGPRKQNKLVCEAFSNDGTTTREAETVRKHWESAFTSKYMDPPIGDFDDEFYMERIMELEHQEQLFEVPGDLTLNRPITHSEVRRAVMKSKSRKACGVDEIPNEALKNDLCINILHRFVSLCFSVGKIPAEWSKCLITVIPKGNRSIPTEPLTF